MTERSQLVTPKAGQTRERILQAALELFRDRGFEQTTMRDVATAAGVATGAAYYYFRSKEEVVLAFYAKTAEEMRTILPSELARTRDLKKRLRRILELKLIQLEPYRPVLRFLFREATDPGSPLSPFGEETKAIRDETVEWFRVAVEGSTETIPRELEAPLPFLLWMFEMGLILFWLHDRSAGQQRTIKLMHGTLDLAVAALRLSRLPLVGPLRRKAASIIRDAGMAG
jgi:AcrR family transcriptional regulator